MMAATITQEISMKRLAIPALLLLTACIPPSVAPPPPTWNPVTEASEAEYAPFLAGGDSTLTGQAFLSQQGGGVVKAAGRTIRLDPATTTGNEWWGKAGATWPFRDMVPPSPNFTKARKTAVADADGRFHFEHLTPGKYFLQTEITWETGYTTEGGTVTQQIEVKPGANEVILNHM